MKKLINIFSNQYFKYYCSSMYYKNVFIGNVEIFLIRFKWICILVLKNVA